MHRDGKSISKISSYNKKLHISTRFKREIVTNQSKSQKELNDKIEKEQVKLSEKLTKISEKLNQTFQNDLK